MKPNLALSFAFVCALAVIAMSLAMTHDRELTVRACIAKSETPEDCGADEIWLHGKNGAERVR